MRYGNIGCLIGRGGGGGGSRRLSVRDYDLTAWRGDPPHSSHTAKWVQFPPILNQWPV